MSENNYVNTLVGVLRFICRLPSIISISPLKSRRAVLVLPLPGGLIITTTIFKAAISNPVGALGSACIDRKRVENAEPQPPDCKSGRAG